MTPFRISLSSIAALCAIMSASITLAEDGVVQMANRGPRQNTQQAPGVVQLGQSRGIQQVSYTAGQCGEQTCAPQCGPVCPQPCSPCDSCQTGGCQTGNCWTGTCYSQTDCNSYFSSCDASGMPMCWCNRCQCSPCQCHSGCQVTTFAQSCDTGTGSACRDMWRGHSMSFLAKNQRLSQRLFGWMIPSGCCGQGCPPIGAYQITYAEQPDYINPQDTQMYAAQGYGMPMTVPLAPNVNYSYNYSSGLPASRLTHIGNYNPQTSVQPLYRRTWP